MFFSSLSLICFTVVSIYCFVFHMFRKHVECVLFVDSIAKRQKLHPIGLHKIAMEIAVEEEEEEACGDNFIEMQKKEKTKSNPHFDVGQFMLRICLPPGVRVFILRDLKLSTWPLGSRRVRLYVCVLVLSVGFTQAQECQNAVFFLLASCGIGSAGSGTRLVLHEVVYLCSIFLRIFFLRTVSFSVRPVDSVR